MVIVIGILVAAIIIGLSVLAAGAICIASKYMEVQDNNENITERD